MPSLYVPIILGTVREGRKSEHVARFVLRRIEKRPDVETRLFDPRELPFGNLVAREWEMDPQPPEVAAFVREMARADGFILAFPEYNHGYPGALKNVLDHLYDEWNRKPFGLVSAGGMSGGMRAQELVRVVVGGVGGVPVPSGVAVQSVGKTFDENGPTSDAERWEKRVDKFLDEVEWYARALKRARDGE